MTTNVFNKKDSDREWYLIDAKEAILGRLATEAAELLRGKKKSTYTPNMDSGDNVVIVNASKVTLSREDNRAKKTYYRHSGYPGGIKSETFEEAMEKHPDRVIRLAVAGMMPKNKLAKVQLKRLKIYETENHPHTQKLINYELNRG